VAIQYDRPAQIPGGGVMSELTVDELHKMLLEEREASELTRGEEIAEPGVRRNRGRAQVFSVRLYPDEIGRIEEAARAAGVPVSSLVRGWILRGLAEHSDSSLSSAVERLRVDVERVRELLG
jgi:hypothetical protein